MDQEKEKRPRERVLEEAMQIICSDRNEQYGEPEDNFAVIASLWNVYVNHKKCKMITAKDVAIMMTLFKIGRMTTADAQKWDSFLDAIGYLACAAEIEFPLPY